VEAQRAGSLSGKFDEQDNANEAGAYRAMAEKLMRQYRVEEEQLIAEDPVAVVPVMHSMLAYSYETDFFGAYRSMVATICKHAEIEYQLRYSRSGVTGEENGWWVDLFGYEGDLRAAEWLWSSARLVFGSHLEPRVDPGLSEQVNAYNLRRAGVLRKDIARALWGRNDATLRAKAQRLYVAECRTRGEEPALSGMGSDADTYRQAYADSFVSALWDRLKAARDAADSVGGVMVLAGRKERVLEALYTAYPNRRPQPRTEVAPVDPPVPAKVDKRRKAWTQADERAYQRRNNGSAQAGRRAGRAAADHVEIRLTHTPAKRVDPAPIPAIEG